MRVIGRGTALFFAGIVAGAALGALLAGGRGPRSGAETPSSHEVMAAADAADRSVDRRGVIFAPAVAGERGASGGEAGGAETRSGRGAAGRVLPAGDATAAIVLEALRAAAGPIAISPHAQAGATLTAAAGDGRRIGRISGHVRRPDGTPIAGAVVTLVPGDLGDGQLVATAPAAPSEARGPGLDPSSPEQDIASELRSAVVRHARFRALSRKIATGADGAYEANDLAPIPYDISASHPTSPIDRDHAAAYDVLPDAVVDLVGIPAAPLSVTVVKPDGSPAEGATVEAVGPSRRSWIWASDAATVWVQPGTYVIEARHSQGGVLLRARSKTLIVEEGDDGSPVRIELAAAPQISGRVVLAAGPKEAPDLTSSYVWYGRVPPDATPSVDLLKRRQRTVTPQPDGRYVIDDLGPGRWMLGVARNGQVPSGIEVVDLTDGPVVKDLTLAPLDETDMVAVRVLGPDGAPRGGADVRLICSFAGGNEMSNDAVLERPGGHYLLVFDGALKKQIAEPRQPGERFTLYVTVPGIGSTTRQLTSLSGGEITIQLGPGATLAVTVEGIGGAMDEQRATVVLATPEQRGDVVDNSQRDCSRNPDAQGRALLGPVEAGAYVLHLLYESENINGRREVARKKIELVPGENQAELKLPPLAKVVIDGVPEGSASLYPIAGDADWCSNVNRDGDGRVVLDLLPPGSYALMVYANENEQTGLLTLRVSGGSMSCRFAPERPDHVEVRAVYLDDDERAAGLERGDVLLTVCGKPLTDPYRYFDDVRALAQPEEEETSPEGAENQNPDDAAPPPQPAPVRPPRRLQVMRGGRVVDLEFKEAIERSFQYGIQRWRPMPRR